MNGSFTYLLLSYCKGDLQSIVLRSALEDFRIKLHKVHRVFVKCRSPVKLHGYFTLTFRIIVCVRLFISKKFSILYGLIWNCTIINFRHFLLYMKLIRACTIIKFRNFHEFTTSVCITEKIPCLNPYPSEKYTDIHSMKQKQTKALRHLEFVNFQVEIWEQGWGPFPKAPYCY